MAEEINIREDEDEDELDITLSVFESPLDPLFPRRPNVVSHRRHELEIVITVNHLPDTTVRSLSVSADVIALGPERLGHEEHTSRPLRVWGNTAAPVVFQIDPNDLPARLPVRVERRPDDDHLGQGPYDAYVTVTLGDPVERDEGGGISVITNRTFGIRFNSM